MGLSLRGTTSGAVDINAPAVAGDNTITLPDNNGAANQFYKNSGTAGIVTYSSMIEDSSGRIGIGIEDPQYKIHVRDTNGSVVSIDRDGGLANLDFIAGLRFGNNDGSGSPPHGTGIKVVADDTFGSAKMHFLSANRNAWDNDIYAMTINSDGDIGIGTDNPRTPLTVKSLDNADSISIQGRNADGISNFTLYGSDGATQYGRIQARSTYLHLAAGDSTKGTYIDSSGRLLVGTSSAATVGQAQYGFIRNIGNTSGLSGYGVNSIGRGIAASTVIGSNATLGMLTFTDSIGGEFGRIECRTANATSSSSYPGDLRFYTTSDGATSPTERMRIDSSGRLLVDTTTAYGKIHAVASPNPVSGTTWLSAAYVASGSFGGGYAILDGSKGYSIFASDGGNDFHIQGHTSTTAAASGGVLLNDRATSWTSASDEREKQNLVPITEAINKVKTLRTVTGNYVWAPDTDHAFLVAQDVQEVLPEAVSVMNKNVAAEDQRLGIAYAETIPLLTAALKEAIAKIETLETQNADLLSRVTALEG